MTSTFSGSDATILLLDSEPAMRAGIRDALQSARYLVVTAGDLGEAVDRIGENRPDLLIVRPYINSMPGRMAADYLRSKCHGLPVLILAGFLNDDRTNVPNTIQEFHSFPKPFSKNELLGAVRDVMQTITRRR